MIALDTPLYIGRLVFGNPKRASEKPSIYKISKMVRFGSYSSIELTKVGDSKNKVTLSYPLFHERMTLYNNNITINITL
jgi:hypothetical protein